MNIVSFSLWGDNPMYNMGFIMNYGLHRKIYKDWEFVLYYDDTISDDVKDFIKVKNIKYDRFKYPWRILEVYG